MELLALLAGWTRQPLAEGTHLVAPAGTAGSVTLLPRLIPIPRLRALAEARVGPGAALGPLRPFVTLEGEHGGAVTARSAAGERTLALVVGDESAALVDGWAGDDAGEPVVRAVVLAIAEHLFLGLGEVRRRRYRYRPPPGWAGIPAPHAARWLHPGYPRTAHRLTVRDARPRAMTAPEITDRVLFSDETRGLLKDPPHPLVDVATPSGLTGQVARIGGRRAEGAPHTTTLRATLADDRFAYVLELDAPTEDVEQSLPAFWAAVQSVEPVPRPRAPDLSARVVSWGD